MAQPQQYTPSPTQELMDRIVTLSMVQNTLVQQLQQLQQQLDALKQENELLRNTIAANNLPVLPARLIEGRFPAEAAASG